jgi:hypothetical protein
MTLQSSGIIRMSDINHEIGKIPDNGNIWMDHDWLRTLAGRPGSGTRISMSDFYGKSSYQPLQVTPHDGNASGNNPSGLYSNQFTSSCSPSVTPAMGTGNYTYTWTITAGSGFTLTNQNSQSCSISHLISRGGYTGTCTLNCAVSDGVNTVNVTVYANFDYETNM